jgi:hypothetical protein
MKKTEKRERKNRPKQPPARWQETLSSARRGPAHFARDIQALGDVVFLLFRVDGVERQVGEGRDSLSVLTPTHAVPAGLLWMSETTKHACQ